MSTTKLSDISGAAQGHYLLTLFRRDMQQRLEQLITDDLLEQARPRIKAMVEQAVLSLEPTIRAMANEYGQQLVVNVTIRDPEKRA